MESIRRGPGLAKGRSARIVKARTVRLFGLTDGWWARLLHEADVISEGRVVREPEGRDAPARRAPRFSYYGTTSLRCRMDPAPAGCDGLSIDALAQLVMSHPHARLRVVRIAHREAVVRAGGTLSVVHAEIDARTLLGPTGTLLAIDVDVSAEVLELHRGVAVD